MSGFWGGEILGDGAVELRNHILVLHEYLLEFIAGVVVELHVAGVTIFVKSMNRMPLSCSSLKKLKSCLIFY